MPVSESVMPGLDVAGAGVIRSKGGSGGSSEDASASLLPIEEEGEATT